MATRKSQFFIVSAVLLMSVLSAGITMAEGTPEAGAGSPERSVQTPVTSESFNLSKVDFSKAIMSIAGPRHIYIRKALYDSQEVSFIIEAENIAERVCGDQVLVRRGGGGIRFLSFGVGTSPGGNKDRGGKEPCKGNPVSFHRSSPLGIFLSVSSLP